MFAGPRSHLSSGDSYASPALACSLRARRERVMKRTLVLNVVGLTPALLEHAPNLKAARGARRHAPADHGDARPSRPRCSPPSSPARCRASTASSPTAGISAISPRSGSGASPTAWWAARSCGKPRSGATRPSPAPSCSGGTTCIRRPTSRSRRGRCIRPTAASCPTSTRTRRSLRDELQQRLGQFPLFRFWGPAADIVSSRWIGRSALRRVRASAPDADAGLPAAPRLQPAAVRPE